MPPGLITWVEKHSATRHYIDNSFDGKLVSNVLTTKLLFLGIGQFIVFLGELAPYMVTALVIGFGLTMLNGKVESLVSNNILDVKLRFQSIIFLHTSRD